MNSKDPLLKTGPEAELELFRRMVEQVKGFTLSAARGAGTNLIINALRQEYPTRAAAEAAFDELFGKAKQILVDHYDSTGRKRGIFPYNQVLYPELHIDRDRINGR